MDEQVDLPLDGSVKCENCGAQFGTHEELNQHVALAHSEEEVMPELAEDEL